MYVYIKFRNCGAKYILLDLTQPYYKRGKQYVFPCCLICSPSSSNFLRVISWKYCTCYILYMLYTVQHRSYCKVHKLHRGKKIFHSKTYACSCNFLLLLIILHYPRRISPPPPPVVLHHQALSCITCLLFTFPIFLMSFSTSPFRLAMGLTVSLFLISWLDMFS
jgi:hypothetical protein